MQLDVCAITANVHDQSNCLSVAGLWAVHCLVYTWFNYLIALFRDVLGTSLLFDAMG